MIIILIMKDGYQNQKYQIIIILKLIDTSKLKSRLNILLEEVEKFNAKAIFVNQSKRGY